MSRLFLFLISVHFSGFFEHGRLYQNPFYLYFYHLLLFFNISSVQAGLWMDIIGLILIRKFEIKIKYSFISKLTCQLIAFSLNNK